MSILHKAALVLFALILGETLLWGVVLKKWPSVKYYCIAAVLLAALTMAGCAALPIPFQPANEQYNSNMAEGAWLVVEGVDTAQTMHLREVRNVPANTRVSCNHEADPIAAKIYGSQYPSPSRVLVTNLLLATVHTMVTSWLDDKVAAEATKQTNGDDNNLGPWYVGRIAWHTVSLAYSVGSVLNNVKQGCEL
jgi:outer membrane murein-binding lipoprotein Lpp